ncbi:MAG: 2-oxoglutarate/2-oxoacid ferredoxin oxidoreductase, gamma subunit [Candidatus Bipolaricaulis sibiricus]|uniref:2-oxoglutarate/2-oxoacid ferredoxin oxidoreductase, gamma subunit n=1 Tax=Bipolaricaulis sibiricus TaxID=2501609 RepID=A0A410FSR1_BIPS1|nr:MAG: 2-oxoglutarate/2-oxoacid ferredoxin oxidoreductase, gamma subunit [Candidatus Bipolaricaulis sibiricus]
MSTVVRIAGSAGQGVQTLGDILARSVFRSGLYLHGEMSYHSRIRGGENTFTLRIGESPVLATEAQADLLVALNEEMLVVHRPAVREGGVVFTDEEVGEPGHGAVRLPAGRLARDELKLPIAAGVILLGAAARFLGLTPEVVRAEIRAAFGEKAEPNVRAVDLGYAHGPAGTPRLPAPRFAPGDRMLLTGGQAVGAGAIAAGCRFVASYPMTPGTAVFEFIAQHAAQHGIVVEQAEDEIAAINMALGASYAGARALVTTSGGGFALMVEGLSLARMIETPVVIHLGQRPGPATGLPTRTGQENLLFALHAGHGEFPRYIVAPTDPADAFYLTMKAFEVAEKYQVPAFVLTDQFLVDSYAVVSALSPTRVPVEEHLVPVEELDRLGRYERFAVTRSGISPRALPGVSEKLVLVDSDEHDPYGRITEDLGVRRAMVEKRLRKADGMREEISPPEIYPAGSLRGKRVLLGWGSTYGAIREATERLGEGYAHVHLRELWPLRTEELRRVWGEAEEVILVEETATGQLGRLVGGETGLRPHRFVPRYDGRPFTAEDILGALR